MVDDMTAPKKVDFMTQTMGPIITQIIKEKEDKESPYVVWNLKQTEFLKKESVNTDRKHFEKNTRNLRDHSKVNVGNGIIQPIGRVFLKPQNEQLNPHQDKVHRDGDYDRTQIHLSISYLGFWIGNLLIKTQKGKNSFGFVPSLIFILATKIN